jgi:hypothetical protein
VAALQAGAASTFAGALLQHAIVCVQRNNAKSIADHFSFIFEEE